MTEDCSYLKETFDAIIAKSLAEMSKGREGSPKQDAGKSIKEDIERPENFTEKPTPATGDIPGSEPRGTPSFVSWAEKNLNRMLASKQSFPEDFPGCVKHLVKDSNFEAFQDFESKKEAAEANCAWIARNLGPGHYDNSEAIMTSETVEKQDDDELYEEDMEMPPEAEEEEEFAEELEDEMVETPDIGDMSVEELKTLVSQLAEALTKLAPGTEEAAAEAAEEAAEVAAEIGEDEAPIAEEEAEMPPPMEEEMVAESASDKPVFTDAQREYLAKTFGLDFEKRAGDPEEYESEAAVMEDEEDEMEEKQEDSPQPTGTSQTEDVEEDQVSEMEAGVAGADSPGTEATEDESGVAETDGSSEAEVSKSAKEISGWVVEKMDSQVEERAGKEISGRSEQRDTIDLNEIAKSLKKGDMRSVNFWETLGIKRGFDTFPKRNTDYKPVHEKDVPKPTRVQIIRD